MHRTNTKYIVKKKKYIYIYIKSIYHSLKMRPRQPEINRSAEDKLNSINSSSNSINNSSSNGGSSSSTLAVVVLIVVIIIVEE